MEVAEAYNLISRAIDQGRQAHGYLIVGDVQGNCSELKDLIVRKLIGELLPIRENIPERDRQAGKIPAIIGWEHPDLAVLSPEGKGRIISVSSMRDRIVAPMATTAFNGGWKVGVIYSADRLNEESTNAFLKSLEEPTPKTLYLLLTDQPDSILPTIVSRCQRVDLRLPPGILEGEDYEEVAELFAARNAAGLAKKLEALKDEAEDEDAAIVRKTFYRTLMSFVRKLMLKGELPRYQVFRNIEAVEEAYRRSEQYIGDEAVLSYMLDRIRI